MVCERSHAAAIVEKNRTTASGGQSWVVQLSRRAASSAAAMSATVPAKTESTISTARATARSWSGLSVSAGIGSYFNETM